MLHDNTRPKLGFLLFKIYFYIDMIGVCLLLSVVIGQWTHANSVSLVVRNQWAYWLICPGPSLLKTLR